MGVPHVITGFNTKMVIHDDWMIRGTPIGGNPHISIQVHTYPYHFSPWRFHLNFMFTVMVESDKPRCCASKAETRCNDTSLGAQDWDINQSPKGTFWKWTIISTSMDPGFNSYDKFTAGYTRPWWILPRESTEPCCPILLLERDCAEMITLNPAMGEAMMRPARHFCWSWMSMTEAFLRCWLDWQHFATKSTGSMASWWMTCRKKLPKGLLEGRWFEHTSAAYLRLLWSESLGCSNIWMVHDF